MNDSDHFQNLNAISKNIEQLAQEAFDKIKAGIGSKAFSVLLKDVLKDYSQEVQQAVQLMANDYTKLGDNTQPLKLLNGLTLSESLYANAALGVAPVVTRLVNESVNQMQTAQQLSRLIYEGYDFQDDPLKVKKALPKYLYSELEKAVTQAKTLKTPSLKAAYLQALNRIEKGAHRDAINKALQVAFYERNRYYANRIAQTELHRVHSDTRAAEIMADDGIDWVQIKLSTTHPKYDICDYHANLNAYGKGKGVYPKAKAPKPPFHPHCRCLTRPRVDIDPPKTEPVRNQSAERDMMRNLSKGEQVTILGSELKRVQYFTDPRLNVLDIVDAGKPKGYETRYVGDAVGLSEDAKTTSK